MENKKNTYETTFIVNASLEDPQIENVINQVSEIITRNGGEISAVNRWGRKRLAYTIKKKNNGYYVNIEFVGPPAMITQLERMYILDENILRFLTIHLDKKALNARLQSPKPESFEEHTEPEEPAQEPLFDNDDKPDINL